MRTRIIARAVIVAAVLSTATAAVAAGVSLPSQANSHAVQATASVTTGSSNASHGQNDSHPASTPSPNEHAAFGQCVAANAKTASDNAGQGWNPTNGCTNANANAANANANANANAGTNGIATADTHANSHASTGLSTAATHSGSHP